MIDWPLAMPMLW